MKQNSRKRSLPLIGKPNKYSSSSSSSSSGNKKRALNVRPPQPASVARLESLLYGSKKKKKKQKQKKHTQIQKSQPNAAIDKKKRIDGDGKGEQQTNPDSMRTTNRRISKSGTTSKQALTTATTFATIAVTRRVSDENTKNEAYGDNDNDHDDRWSHLNSKAKSSKQHKARIVVNPFLEMNHRKRKPIQNTTNTETGGTKTDAPAGTKPAKLSPDVFLSSKAKEDRMNSKPKAKQLSIIEDKEFRSKEETNRNGGTNGNHKKPVPATTIPSKKVLPSPSPPDRSNQAISSDTHSKHATAATMNSHSKNDDNHRSQKSCSPSKPPSLLTERPMPTTITDKETIIATQNQAAANQKTTAPTTVFQALPIDERKDLGIIPSNASSFRPKLGLRLCNRNNNKTIKGKQFSASMSGPRFRSSLSSSRPPSTDFLQTTPPVEDAGNGSREEGLLMVLESPGKSNSSLSLPQHQSLNVGADTRDPSSHGNTTAINDRTAKIPALSGLHAAITTRTNNNDGTNNVSFATSRNKTFGKPTFSKKKNNKINDNFVRLNMKNNAGACRGAKNKSSKYSKERRSWNFRGGAANDGGSFDHHAPMGSLTNPSLTFDAPLPPTTSSFSKDDIHSEQRSEHDGDERRGGRYSRFNRYNKKNNNSKSNATSYVSKMSGLDPLDEFVDGTFHSSETKTKKAKNPKQPLSKSAATATTTKTVFGGTMAAEAPKCARHQRPCKLIKVRKATTGNKGREFYACSMPRGEQCDHFQWADDTLQAARNTIAKNTTYSSFITRQVASYVDRFRTFTVPELKHETSKRGLNKNGKKQQLLMRLAIWTRDELVKCSPKLANEEEPMEGDVRETNTTDTIDSCICETIQDDEDSRSSDGDSSSSSSDDELELFDGAEESDQEDDGVADTDDEEMSCGTNNRLAIANGEHIDDGGSVLAASLREIFGHNDFRDGQEWAIQRCLDEKPSLLVAPTGFGKSLCYALPAALMDGVCIVVSPLISLIQDQLRSLPPRIPAATLSGSISAAKTAAIVDDIVRNRLKILFVSPERLTSPAFRRLFNLRWNPETNTKERKFPEISLLCIDEAHCISQWAHNFRPCFLRFKGFLKIMKPKSILAITATAGPRVIRDIGQTLGMDFPESITEESPKTATDSEHESIKIIRSGRDNIDVMGKFMSNQEERLAVVAGILTPAGTGVSNKKNPYAGKLARGSTIVYVWRQRDTEVVAESLTAAGVTGGVVVYHGGMNANARAKSQSKFMRGKARICVATVAFGLGIDKADIVGIVHLYLSNSPEHYLQEIGRAGRDGRSATAIALPLLEEVPTRHSLGYSNLVAKSQIRSLLHIIKRLVASAGKVCDMVNSNSGRYLHISLPVQATVCACDCKPETIETFLSLIERIGGDNPLLQIEGYNYDGASIAMKKRTLKKLAEREPVADSILAVSQCIDAPLAEAGSGTEKVAPTAALPSAFQRHFIAYSKGSHSFSISQCANKLGPTAEPRHVFAALRRLQSSNELEFVLDTSEKGRIFQLKVSEMGFELFHKEEYATMEENLVDTIFESFTSSSDSGAIKFLDMHYILDKVAHASELSTDIDASDDQQQHTSSDSEKSSSLIQFQELTSKYFGEGLESERLATKGLLPASFSKIREKELKIDGLSLLRDLPPLFQQYGGNNSNSNNNSRYNPTRTTSEKDLLPEHLMLGDTSRVDYTALAITKFLHGIDTPRTPYLTFRQYPMFGKWKTVDFRLVHKSILKVVESRASS